jgi:hypothetical protein
MLLGEIYILRRSNAMISLIYWFREIYKWRFFYDGEYSQMMMLHLHPAASRTALFRRPLIYDGKQSEDQQTSRDYGIQNGAVLDLGMSPTIISLQSLKAYSASTRLRLNLTMVG